MSWEAESSQIPWPKEPMECFALFQALVSCQVAVSLVANKILLPVPVILNYQAVI